MNLPIQRSGRFGKHLANICLVLDLGVVNLAFWLTTLVAHGGESFNERAVWILANLVFAVVHLWIGLEGFVRSNTLERMIRIVVKETLFHAFIFIAILYFIHFDNMAWQPLAVFYGFLFVGLVVVRILIRLVLGKLRSKGYNYTSVAIVGSGSQAERLIRRMKDASTYGYRIKGVFGPEPAEGSALAEYYKGSVDALEPFMALEPVDEVYYCSLRPDAAEITRAARLAESRLLQFYFVPQVPRQILGSFQAGSIGSVPVLRLNDSPLKSSFNAGLKRGFDIVFSALALAVTIPLVWLPVAIAIKRSSPGPVFFKQKRTGLKGKEFYCLKFRTMRVNSDSDNVQATENDPRKTRVGDFLRKTSIDELPQFWNVLKGDMSVIGPRPHMLKHTTEYSELIDTYMVRHAVRPGISGWAQVNGYRGKTDELWKMEGRVEHDIWYIENWSLLLDLKIVAQTLINAFKGEENAF